jgi:hypothetical protein
MPGLQEWLNKEEIMTKPFFSGILLCLMVVLPACNNIRPAEKVPPTATPSFVLQNPPALSCVGFETQDGAKKMVQVTCRFQSVHCVYFGSTTWCYDTPSPNNTISAYINDVDLSAYDGHCVVIVGWLGYLGGKPLLMLDDASRVSDCP